MLGKVSLDQIAQVQELDSASGSAYASMHGGNLIVATPCLGMAREMALTSPTQTPLPRRSQMWLGSRGSELMSSSGPLLCTAVEPSGRFGCFAGASSHAVRGAVPWSQGVRDMAILQIG